MILHLCLEAQTYTGLDLIPGRAAAMTWGGKICLDLLRLKTPPTSKLTTPTRGCVLKRYGVGYLLMTVREFNLQMVRVLLEGYGQRSICMY